MKLMDACLHVAHLKLKIERNKEVLKTLQNKTSDGFFKVDREKMFENTCRMMDEVDFYTNQIRDIETHYGIDIENF